MLDRIQRAGISAVEIFCALQHIDWNNRAQINELGHWFRSSELKLHSLHSPMFDDNCWGLTGPQSQLNITESVKARRIAIVDQIKRAIEIAEVIPCKYVVQHLGGPTEEWSERGVDMAFSSLEELGLFARQRGVQILLENIPNGFSTAERLVNFLDLTHLDLYFCFDSGHANLMGGVEKAFEIMKPRIRSTHLHDNDGEKDLHYFPFGEKKGTINWQRFLPTLASDDAPYPLLLELKEDTSIENPIEQAASIFDRFEELAAAPVEER